MHLLKITQKCVILIVLGIGLICVPNSMAEYSKEEICSAIYIIEGGDQTNYPYGIKSVNCDGKEDCKNVCFNTVVNNVRRYTTYGFTTHATFLEFLQSRYCPLSDKGCENWLPNLKFYLEKE